LRPSEGEERTAAGKVHHIIAMRLAQQASRYARRCQEISIARSAGQRANHFSLPVSGRSSAGWSVAFTWG
jgi:hypothetical protein